MMGLIKKVKKFFRNIEDLKRHVENFEKTNTTIDRPMGIPRHFLI